MAEKDIWDKINVVTAILLLVATYFLVQANFQLVEINKQFAKENEQLVNISDIQRQISESQKNIMQSNLDLIKPNLKCWWTSTNSGNNSVTSITVINFGQLPGQLSYIYVRPPANFGGDKDIINYTVAGTPANVIRSGDSKTFSIESNLTNINTAKIFTTDNNGIYCEKINESTTTYISTQ